ncbi:unnamed protein product [Pneumocystis jirovecii]|uniref:DUF4112 domain-containing protein n=1 Tax=Pneumocystis jirovecii TaxID=42068 RepID=L0PG88_PNEJI|nr:unnamed protein product [Pneumocystis jirovecii]
MDFDAVFQQWDPYDKEIKEYLEMTKKKSEINFPGLSNKEFKIMKKAILKSAYRLDYAIVFFCCETRFGWSTVIGIIPVIGDIINLYLSIRLVRLCMSVNLSYKTVIQMYANIIIAFTMGVIPIIGDMLFACYKCNIRNYILLEKTLKEREKMILTLV